LRHHENRRHCNQAVCGTLSTSKPNDDRYHRKFKKCPAVIIWNCTHSIWICVHFIFHWFYARI
jgi:hypothetical protein